MRYTEEEVKMIKRTVKDLKLFLLLMPILVIGLFAARFLIG
ncbi:MAG: hypothetical protein ACM32O_13425 [Clostridia bacterium]